MKTTKITAVLSLVLILLGTSLLNAGNISRKAVVSNINLVRYQVNIHMMGDISLCNLWYVAVTDGNGNVVAPPQGFNTDISSYFFYEKGPVTGVRVARMYISNTTMHYSCDPEFNVYPDFRTGTFLNGETITFDLYPNSTQPPKP